MLVKDRLIYHYSRNNSKKPPPNFKVRDIVKAHIQVQSNASNNVVGKLFYGALGLFTIKECLGVDTYQVQCYSQPT